VRLRVLGVRVCLAPSRSGGRTPRGGLRSLYEDADRAGYAGYGGAGTWPRVSLFDTGTALVLTADVPGLAEKDLKLTVHQDVLTLSGERKSDAPEGYSTHRRERAPASFSRSFALPSKVDAEKTTAQLKNGVLTVTLSKVPEAQPRQIQVQVR
jgi:HSP20 family molecular chaperone IbpA